MFGLNLVVRIVGLFVIFLIFGCFLFLFIKRVLFYEGVNEDMKMF